MTVSINLFIFLIVQIEHYYSICIAYKESKTQKLKKKLPVFMDQFNSICHISITIFYVQLEIKCCIGKVVC